MCLGGGSSAKAPVNTPAYAPEEADEHFDYSEETDSSDRSNPLDEEPLAGKKTVKPTNNILRM